MSIDALRVLLMTFPMFLVKLANWNLFFNVHVQVLAIALFSTSVFQPMDTNFLLSLALIWHIGKGVDQRLELVVINVWS